MTVNQYALATDMLFLYWFISALQTYKELDIINNGHY